MATNYTVTNSGSSSDFSDLFIPRNLFSSGRALSWGLNTNGRLGDNTIVHRSSPVQTLSGGTNWKQISSRNAHTSAIRNDGSLWVWGLNTNGQLGDNSIVHRSSPVQTVSGGTNWKQVAVGSFHTAAIKTDGTLWLWGLNTAGQLGQSNVTVRSSPVQTISVGSNWKQVACGDLHTSAIKTDGTLWTWGHAQFGRLGDDTTVHRSSPVQTIAGGTNWKLVACGSYNTAAIKTDGTLWLWGSSNYGQLGNNSITSVSSPIQTIAAGTDWKQVSAGAVYHMAIKTDGTLWLWGGNTYGQLGNNSTDRVSSPIQTVAGGTNWKQVSAGRLHSTALKTDGTLWTWGRGLDGRLGNNGITDRSSPVQTVAGGTNWKQVAGGAATTFGITDIF